MKFNTLALIFVVSTGVKAQELNPSSGESSPDIEPLSAASAPVDSAVSAYKEERAQFQKILETEIIPNLPAQDVEKLQRSVQRLGSYRVEWSQSAQDFLIANAPVAELMLYKFSVYQNPRLSLKILKTLLGFGSLRFPRAALAYADVFHFSPEAKLMTLRLMAKAVAEDARLAEESLQLLSSSWASDIPAQEKLSFVVDSCPAWAKVGLQAQPVILQWGEQANDLWGRLLKVEALSCAKGL